MTGEIERVGALVRQLGGEFSLKTFDERLVIQKAVCLTQSLDTQNVFGFDYYFSWYRRGPYSVSLTKDAFSMEQKGEHVADPLDDRQKQLLERIKKYFGDFLTDIRKLELIGSIAFLYKEKENQTRESIFQKVGILKPGFEESEVKEAIDKYFAYLEQTSS